MAETTETQQIIERVVSEVLQGQVTQLRELLVRRVVEELPASANGGNPASEAGAAPLLKAVAAIHAGNTQREILRALLDNMARYSGRAALFVIKGGTATGWQSRGFGKSDEDPVKDFALDVTAGLAERALQSRTTVGGSAREMDGQFVSQFGSSASGEGLVLPLVLKEKVAALVYTDPGTEADGKMDAAVLELLVLSASAWLEVTSLRKQAQKEQSAAGSSPDKAESPVAAQHASSFSDPFAAHAPKHAAAAAAAAGAAESSIATVVPVSVPSDGAHAVAAHVEVSPEDAETHQKAQRFARLLVDEIKLYNQAKVAEGRKHKDLYDRLKEDIEKSRSTYQKRYGNTAAASGDYFTHELVRSLAEDDPSIMGASFRR